MDLESKSQLLKFYFQHFFLNLTTKLFTYMFQDVLTHFDSSFSGARMVADDAVTNSTSVATR